MRTDAKQGSSNSHPGQVAPRRFEAELRVRRWGVIGLVLLTTLAVGSISLWLVPPYWLVMAWLLTPPGGWRGTGSSDLAGSEPLPERAGGIDVDAPTTEGSPSPTDEPPPPDADSIPSVKPRRKRSGRTRSKKKAQSDAAEPNVAATWVRVGPNQFVRVEVPVEPTEESPAQVETPPTEEVVVEGIAGPLSGESSSVVEKMDDSNQMESSEDEHESPIEVPVALSEEAVATAALVCEQNESPDTATADLCEEIGEPTEPVCVDEESSATASVEGGEEAGNAAEEPLCGRDETHELEVSVSCEQTTDNVDPPEESGDLAEPVDVEDDPYELEASVPCEQTIDDEVPRELINAEASVLVAEVEAEDSESVLTALEPVDLDDPPITLATAEAEVSADSPEPDKEESVTDREVPRAGMGWTRRRSRGDRVARVVDVRRRPLVGARGLPRETGGVLSRQAGRNGMRRG